jgi:hypothetical protein
VTEVFDHIFILVLLSAVLNLAAVNKKFSPEKGHKVLMLWHKGGSNNSSVM